MTNVIFTARTGLFLCRDCWLGGNARTGLLPRKPRLCLAGSARTMTVARALRVVIDPEQEA